jgi:hypothetical protein
LHLASDQITGSGEQPERELKLTKEMQRGRPVQAAPAQPINAILLFGEELLARLDAGFQVIQLSLVFAILAHVGERVRGGAVPRYLLIGSRVNGDTN